jgi:hypothetical protein
MYHPQSPQMILNHSHTAQFLERRERNVALLAHRLFRHPMQLPLYRQEVPAKTFATRSPQPCKRLSKDLLCVTRIDTAHVGRS